MAAIEGTVKEWFGPVTREGKDIPSGPWDAEPSKRQWVDESTKLPCLIVRGPSGALCGYVGVAEGHPWFGEEHSELDVEVHGGLTFSNACQHPGDESRGVCHIPEPGTSDKVWWFGFDCCHCTDLVPGMMLSFAHTDETYRDIAYVTAEVTALAQQMMAAA